MRPRRGDKTVLIRIHTHTHTHTHTHQIDWATVSGAVEVMALTRSRVKV